MKQEINIVREWGLRKWRSRVFEVSRIACLIFISECRRERRVERMEGVEEVGTWTGVLWRRRD